MIERGNKILDKVVGSDRCVTCADECGGQVPKTRAQIAVEDGTGTQVTDSKETRNNAKEDFRANISTGQAS